MADDTNSDDIERWLRTLWEFFDGPASQPAADEPTPTSTRWDAR